MVRYSIGHILLFESAFLLVPLITSLIYTEFNAVIGILIASLICLVLGLVLGLKKPESTAVYTKDGFAIVALSWIALSVFGALPFVFSGAVPNYIDALFETVSGFTTTGSSILTDVEAMPKGLLIWRAFSNWIGGMGVLVFVMAIMPLGGGQSMHIMRAESPGPEVSKLVPRMNTTARILYAIYIALTVITFCFYAFDMPIFDAICSAFSTAGTGGFSVKSDSMLSYSPYVQTVATIFMLIFSINFNSYFLVLRLKFREAFNSEVKVFIGIVLAAIVTITINLYLTPGLSGCDSLGDSLRHAAFTVASIVSTSGFSTLDFDMWPILSQTVLVLLTLVGACAGSTAGGFKISRVIILFKGALREIGSIIHPKQVKKITIDDKPVASDVVRSVNAYLVLYVFIFVISFIFLTFDPYVPLDNMSEMSTNFTAVATALNNVGPGLDMVGPTQNFAFFSPISKLILIFDMLAGRLELLPMILLFTPATWKKR